LAQFRLSESRNSDDNASRLTSVSDGTYAAGYTYLPNSSLVGTVTIAGAIRLARSRMLDLLPKDFVHRRLRISIQYAPSSRLAFRKNLRRNRFPPK
jgi:hypothetical protein